MAVELKDVFWTNGGEDLHVVRGHSTPPLDHMLLLESSAGDLKFGDESGLPGGAKITFDPVAPVSNAELTYGIRMDAHGKVITKALPPNAPHIPNFIIKASVDYTVPDPEHPGQRKKAQRTLHRRVHIHNPGPDGKAVVRLTLTPDVLTVRHHDPDPQTRFTALAEFADGTVGNVTRHDGLSWSLTTAAGHLSIDADTGVLTATASGGDRIVKLKLPAALGGHEATAKVSVGEHWSQPMKAVLVDGPGWDNIDVPNVLILPDGYQKNAQVDEEPLFDQLVRELVDRLNTSTTTYPFNLFRGAINYWYAFLPSRERSCSPLNEYYFTAAPGPNHRGPMRAVPTPHAPDVTPGPGVDVIQDRVDFLVYQVGLPLERDLGVAFADKQLEWDGIYGSDHTRGTTATLYEAWRALGRRRLLHQSDTAFGIATGDRPQVENEDDGRGFGWHPDRFDRTQMDKLLRNLTTEVVQLDGTVTVEALGDRFVTKFRELIFVIAQGARFGGAKTQGQHALIAGSMVESSTIAAELTPPSLVPRQLPFPLREHANTELHSLVAHETGHSVQLGDEYGGPYRGSDEVVKERVANALNLQLASDVIEADGNLNPAKMRWNWPRMGKVGVTQATPIPMDADHIRVDVGAGSGFAVGEQVRLRRRPLTEYTGLGPRFTVTGVSTANGVETVQLEVLEPLSDWPSYGKGSLLYKPVLHPTSNDELTMCNPVVAEELESSDRPMSRFLFDDCGPQPAEQTVAQARFLGLRKPLRNPSHLIGYYDGGAEASCGVFHPSGHCAMRFATLRPDTFDNNGNLVPGQVNSFCFVCRYILVDILKPELHPDVDRAYEQFDAI
jgi:hypothetical protein